MAEKDTSIISPIADTTPIISRIPPKTAFVAVEEQTLTALTMYESPIELVAPKHQPGPVSTKETMRFLKDKVPLTLLTPSPLMNTCLMVFTS